MRAEEEGAITMKLTHFTSYKHTPLSSLRSLCNNLLMTDSAPVVAGAPTSAAKYVEVTFECSNKDVYSILSELSVHPSSIQKPVKLYYNLADTNTIIDKILYIRADN